jgi:hypothetical protein
MDSKLYIGWRESLGKWIVKYRGRIKSEHNTQERAECWVQSNYPSHGYEIERVSVRDNSPHGVKKGEWR